jgi:hypothetical protein
MIGPRLAITAQWSLKLSFDYLTFGLNGLGCSPKVQEHLGLASEHYRTGALSIKDDPDCSNYLYLQTGHPHWKI